MVYLVIVKRIEWAQFVGERELTGREYYRTSLVKMKDKKIMLKSEIRRIAAEYFGVIENSITVL